MPTDTIRLRSRATVPGRLRPAVAPAGPGRLLIDDPISARWHQLGLELSAPGRASRLAVRAFDLVVAAVGLVVLSPLMLAIALAIKLDSPGPVLYGSTRIGHRRETFRAWKFRSMQPDADAQLVRLLADDPEARREYRTYHKLRRDPRLTGVGALLRKTSLDELPQLFNILIGQMSVVGPRPKLLNEREPFGDALPLILQVKPGLTGLWQISGRNRLPVRDRVALEVDYVCTRSLRGDLRICLITLAQLLRPDDHGAY